MKIEILLFGVTRDIVGNSKLIIDIEKNNKVGDMMTKLKKEYPDFDNLKSLLVAVNNEYALDHQLLNENDEVALIPPVSGG